MTTAMTTERHHQTGDAALAARHISGRLRAFLLFERIGMTPRSAPFLRADAGTDGHLKGEDKRAGHTGHERNKPSRANETQHRLVSVAAPWPRRFEHLGH